MHSVRCDVIVPIAKILSTEMDLAIIRQPSWLDLHDFRLDMFGFIYVFKTG